MNQINLSALGLDPAYGTLAPFQEMYEIRETILKCPKCRKLHAAPRAILPCLGITAESPCPYCDKQQMIILGHRTNLCFRGDTFLSEKLGTKKKRKWAAKALSNLEERKGCKSNYSIQNGLIFALDGVFALLQHSKGKWKVKKLDLSRTTIQRGN
ncbi:MAG: hypothetical protein HYU74_10000 [Dechloromonas sp.]|nr:hypothetical protein [Dechloromonas sp.]